MKGDVERSLYCETMYPSDDDQRTFPYPDDGLLQVRGCVPPDELKHSEELGPLHVLKNGRAAHTTLGVVNGLQSRTRRTAGGTNTTSMEMCIISSIPDGPFSAPGDSGASIVDRTGRLVCMVTSGAGATASTDLTYATPFWWLFERIKGRYPQAYIC